MGSTDQLGTGLLFISGIMVLQSVVGSYFAHKKIRVFHESAMAILFGICGSAVMKFAFNFTVKLDKHLFLYIFLPIIIFAEGYTLKKRHFFKNITYIMLIGIVGTIVTMIVTSSLISLVSNNDLVYVQVTGDSKFKESDIPDDDGEADVFDTHTPIYFLPKDVLLFASSLSSKDTFIAATMVDHHEFPVIFHVIFGEGVVNDATSLLLFTSLDQLVQEEDSFDYRSLPKIVGKFALSLFVSLVIGTTCGVICSLLLKHLTFVEKTFVHEALIIFFCSFSGYAIVEWLHFSGVLSLLFSGIVCGHFAFYNLSQKGMICCHATFQILSTGAENCLFAYLGFTVFSMYDETWSFSFIGFVMAFLLTSRVLTVISMSLVTHLLAKCFKKKWSISWREQVVLVVTGMSRGILGYVLVLTIDKDQTQGPFFQLLETTSIGVIILSTLMFSVIGPILVDKVLENQDHGSSMGMHMEEDPDLLRASQKLKRISTELEFLSSKNSLSHKLNKFYILKIKPFLIRDYIIRYQTNQLMKNDFKGDKFDLRRPGPNSSTFFRAPSMIVQRSLAKINVPFSLSEKDQCIQEFDKDELQDTLSEQLIIKESSLEPLIQKSDSKNNDQDNA